jgi:uncharacterized protein YdhG (YjbR/CyaY superfamily)
VSYLDEYLDDLEPGQRTALRKVRELVLTEVPQAEEGKSYGMPALMLAGRPLLGFRVAEHHMSIFPFSPSALDAVRARLADFELSKGTIRFSEDRPIPDDVLRDLVSARRAEIEP